MKDKEEFDFAAFPFPPPKEVFGALKKLLQSFNEEEEAAKNWPQVNKLTPGDLLKRRNHQSDMEAIIRELKLLRAKEAVLKASAEAQGEEWWCYLYKTYSLSAGNHHITEDGRILKEPKKEKTDSKK